MPSAEADDLDRLHARNVKIHGRARAELARWQALYRLSYFLHECERRRKDRALLEALEALERARVAEEGEGRWARVSRWVARRIDAAESKLGRTKRLVTRIDFSPAPSVADYGEAIEEEDLRLEADIEW